MKRRTQDQSFSRAKKKKEESGLSCGLNSKDQILEREILPEPQVYMTEDKGELKKLAPAARKVVRFYDPPTYQSAVLKEKLLCLFSKCEASLKNSSASLMTDKDMDGRLESWLGQLCVDHGKILYCLDNLGFACAYEAVKVCQQKLTVDECELNIDISFPCKSYLDEAIIIFEELLPLGAHSNIETGSGQEAVEMGYMTPKLLLLLQVFQLLRKDSEEPCLVFVERRITAEVIERLLRSITSLSHFCISYVTGSNLETNGLTGSLDLFCSKKVDLLFATDVDKEGFHVRNCSIVIHFDLPKTVDNYIQSSGKARRNGSQHIMMLERNNKKRRDELFDIIRTEHTMTDTAPIQDVDPCFLRVCNFQEPDPYLLESAVAQNSADSIMNIVHKCTEKGSGYNEMPSEGELKVQIEKSTAGAGTTKRKELHGTTKICALSGTWKDKPHGATFHAYRFDFSCSVAAEIYSGFVLLTESKLDEGIADAKIDLYLLSKKMVKSLILCCGQVYLDADQITRAIHFQELFFNGLFGKLFDVSKTGGMQREFRLQKHKKLLWESSYMYLLLPLVPVNIESPECWSIDWNAIGSCESVIQFFEESLSLSTKHTQGSCSSLKTDCTISIKEPSNEVEGDFDIIMMANHSFCMNELKGKVVMAVHTGRMYSVLEVLTDTSAQSPFDADPTGSKYISFADYYNKKYGVALLHPKQPMLLLKQTHNAHNLLMDFNSEGVPEEKRNHVRIPPELLVTLDVPSSVLKSAYLIPSLMHRLESLMLASQLREEIAYDSSESHIPSSLILEALTTMKCCENFSLERLELLGDSVLKYGVSHHLFLKFPENNEGDLSDQRSRVVCNATLHILGTRRKLQGYIRDSPFEPRRWCAPGQLCIHPVICSHSVDTSEVPLDSRFQTSEEKVMKMKICDRGHRWMCSKTIADCVEALIGAYYVAGGLGAALHLMKWLGIEVDMEQSYLDCAIDRASLLPHTPKANDIGMLEAKIGFQFSTKGLLLEAITYATRKCGIGNGYSYQRLEFLGDSALDLLITWYLYQAHTDIDPGELTDLRAASVNNDTFAQVAVRYNLYQHLQCLSASLLSQVKEYAALVLGEQDTARQLQGRNAPKVLGDLVESIAGAILLDTKLSLEEVWRIFEPLLSPIVTPDKLQLPPFRELNELCDSLGYFMKEEFGKKKDLVHVELRVQLKHILLVGKGVDRTRKSARGQAAAHLLNDLQNRGITYAECVLRKSRQDLVSGNPTRDIDLAEHASQEDQKMWELPPVSSSPKNSQHPSDGTPVIEAISMRKGGPRTSLHELCKKLQWPMPRYQSTEEKLRSPVEFGRGSDRRTGFNIFVAKISLHIPDSGPIELEGEQRADKKSAQDAAALNMLMELQRQGKLVIGEIA